MNRLHNRLPGPAVLTLVITAGLTFVSWLVAFAQYLAGRPYPYSWPYYASPVYPGMPDGDRFGDLLFYRRSFDHFHSLDFFSIKYGPPFAYPAPMSLFYRLIFYSSYPVLLFESLIVCAVIVAAVCFVVKLRKLGVKSVPAAFFVSSLVLLSSSLAFEMRQLNTEILIFILVASYLFCFLNQRYLLSGVFIGAAMALKLFPFILLGLLFAAKRFRALVLSIATAILLTFLGLLSETPSLHLSLLKTLSGMQTFSAVFAASIQEAFGWDHSLFALLKSLYSLTFPVPNFQKLLHLYLPLVATVCLVLYFFRIRKLPVFNQVACLTVLMVFITPVSYEYTLLHLYSVFAVFCCVLLRRPPQAALGRVFAAIAVCFGTTFGLIGFVIVDGMTWAGHIKSVAMLTLVVLTLLYPIPDPELDPPLLHTTWASGS